MPCAVIFDLDGVLLDSEQLWNEAKEAVTREAGGTWREAAQRDMMGISAGEWSRYLREVLGVGLDVGEINRRVLERMQDMYRRHLPLLPGAVQAVQRMSERWTLGLASSSNRELIDLVLEESGLAARFAVAVSSDEVGRGKPAPDVYLETARRLEVRPGGCVAIEDSSNGIRSGVAAGMAVIAVPNPHYPPDGDALALAAATVSSVAEVTEELVEAAAPGAASNVAPASAAPSTQPPRRR